MKLMGMMIIMRILKRCGVLTCSPSGMIFQTCLHQGVLPDVQDNE